MSVTVSDLLELPSLRKARVIAGQGGLSKIVSSISVLESTDPGVLVDEVFPQGEYFGGEIVITGFLNMTDDVERQYRNMLRLVEGGEVGLIFYYVGVYLKKIDQRLIELANERDFVLIVMPEGNMTLRYSEVICDVTELIYRDRTRNQSLVSEILERVSVLPAYQRNVSTVLKMLSDRISASVVLCDHSLQLLGIAAWPRSLEPEVKKGVGELEGLPPDQQSEDFPFLPGSKLYRFAIRLDRGQDMELLIIKEGIQPSPELFEQAADVVRLGANIWGQEQGEVAVRELIRAIIQDEPIRMRQLAELFHYNVKDIQEMWILHCPENQQERFRREGLAVVREDLGNYCHTVVADIYEGYTVAFMEWNEPIPDRSTIAKELWEQLKKQGFELTLTSCSSLISTADVREAFLAHHENREIVCCIWPGKGCYTLQEIRFAERCRNLLAQGETVMEKMQKPLWILQNVHEDKTLLRTLEVYLLDAGCSVTRCAELLFVHKNTVKYRLGRIREYLGYPLDKFPEAFPLYYAIALRRLTHSS